MADFKSMNGYSVKDEVARTQANKNASDIQALNSDVGNLKDTTSSHTNSISNIQNNMTEVNQNVAAANESIQTTQSYLNSVQANVNAMNETFDGITGDMESLKQDNTLIKDKVNTLETDNSTNKTKISTLEGDNTENKENIGTLQVDVAGLKGVVAYESETATNGNLDLSVSIEGYKGALVTFGDSTNQGKFIDSRRTDYVDLTTGTTHRLITSSLDGVHIRALEKVITFATNKVTSSQARTIYYYNTKDLALFDEDSMGITKIVLIK